MTYPAYAVTTPGLEEIVSAELVQLGIAVKSPVPAEDGGKSEDSGGVSFQASLEQIYIANLHLRCASRIIIRVGEFDAVGFDELRRKAAQIPWDTYHQAGDGCRRPGDLPQEPPVPFRRRWRETGQSHQPEAGDTLRPGQAIRGDREASPTGRGADRERPLHRQHRQLRGTAAPAWLPSADSQGAPAGDAGRWPGPAGRVAAGVSADRSILRVGDHPHRSGHDRAQHRSRPEPQVRIHGLADL